MGKEYVTLNEGTQVKPGSNWDTTQQDFLFSGWGAGRSVHVGLSQGLLKGVLEQMGESLFLGTYNGIPVYDSETLINSVLDCFKHQYGIVEYKKESERKKVQDLKQSINNETLEQLRGVNPELAAQLEKLQ